MDLTQYPPLHGPLVLVPHDPTDGPSPAEQRRHAAAPDNMLNLYARALEGDADALALLGVSSSDEITIIDAREAAPVYLYLMQPDGHTERHEVDGNDEAHSWIDGKLGEAYRVPPSACSVQAYAVIYSAAPGDTRPNRAAQRLSAWRPPFTARWSSRPQVRRTPHPPTNASAKPSAAMPPPAPSWASRPTGKRSGLGPPRPRPCPPGRAN